MRAGRASRTAEQNALFRALEYGRPPELRVCADPLARGFLGWPLSLVARAADVPGLDRLVPWYIDRRWPGVRSSLVARTRLIDEMLGAAVADGVRQVVILGAGFDSRAYRLPGMRACDVFEVDHPATQQAKRTALGRALPAVPEHVRFVAVDFGRDDLASALASAGYREATRTFVLWEGVSNYLTEAAVDATLRWCGGRAAGSLLTFTYVHRDFLTNPAAFVGTRTLLAALDRAGEPMTFGIDPGELPRILARHGLVLESDLGATEYRRRYLGARAERIRGHEFYRVALARVARGAPQPQAG